MSCRDLVRAAVCPYRTGPEPCDLKSKVQEQAILCGQEVPAGAGLPQGFGEVAIAGRYARFATMAHISAMQAVWGEVYGQWLSRPDFHGRSGPSVEYYPPAFDGMTGDGGYEVWVPIT